MNVLCLCDHGEVRSVAMCKVLREHGHFAVAGSFDNYSELMNGSDVKRKNACIDVFDAVIFMNEGGVHFIGRDEWGDPGDAELASRCFMLGVCLGLIDVPFDEAERNNIREALMEKVGRFVSSDVVKARLKKRVKRGKKDAV